jgi:hypothetical protein
VSENTDKEAEIKVREERTSASDQTPGEGLDQISSVVRLADNTPPSRGEQEVTVFSLDVARVLDVTPGKLRECITGNEGAILFHAETVLLGISGIENVVGTQESDKHTNGVEPRVLDHLTSGQFILHKINAGVAVSERNTSHVPENKHETYFSNKKFL